MNNTATMVMLYEKVRVSFKFHSDSYEKYGRELIGKVIRDNNSALNIDTFTSIREIPFKDIIDIEYLRGESSNN